MEYVGNIIYDEELFSEKREFIIFGAGKNGKRILEYLDRNGLKKKIKCFGISNVEQNGSSVENIPVCQIGDVCRQYPNATYLVSGRYIREMCQTLIGYNMKKIHVLFL